MEDELDAQEREKERAENEEIERRKKQKIAAESAANAPPPQAGRVEPAPVRQINLLPCPDDICVSLRALVIWRAEVLQKIGSTTRTIRQSYVCVGKLVAAALASGSDTES